MVKEREITVSLEEFGLSQYEARAYVTLITKGTISASDVAFYAELPRTKVYPVLLKLQQKKLAIISKSKPVMCTAIAPEDAFDEIVHEQINKVDAMNTLVSKMKKISEDSKKARGAEEKRYFHINANYVPDRMRTMIDGAKTSIHVTADSWGLSILAECKEELLSVLRRDLDVRLIVPVSVIGSESFRNIPDGVKIRSSETVQNCFIFDDTEILIMDNTNGRSAVFSGTDILSASQARLFAILWKDALKIDNLSEMTKSQALEVCKIINLINQNGLGFALHSILSSKKYVDFTKFLDKSGISLKDKTLEQVIDIVNSTLEMTCSGRVQHDEKTNSIILESKVNSGHSLPWAMLIESYLEQKGNHPKMIYQSDSHKGEMIHLKIN
ncbi:MAG: TrmB family transcriptional regulator [Nitrososphaeria archaeon]|nr:TrmB family transcriptional regulator [Nitrososphaeria archaeon]NDB52165.1 TrmB family transcriptional regulator [Nitrosopumilaceae archaeon]NDB88819.1 TrmB family transcriptional regulator [Nitrososphaerota archaeon]NDB63526.1 TrmB family transcriptional regulator [Nitrosopumilaceae archaeon]NDB90842.1 TrmB family transcriptional regulator [Nitrososphaerota archaeon]